MQVKSLRLCITYVIYNTLNTGLIKSYTTSQL